MQWCTHAFLHLVPFENIFSPKELLQIYSDPNGDFDRAWRNVLDGVYPGPQAKQSKDFINNFRNIAMWW